ncbi:MAG: SemiSWEET family transporter [Candidatus Daviesbacteria bacterium]|nr:SemiSWEET family transporter [Candidatus Daviesbacteria bacterium]
MNIGFHHLLNKYKYQGKDLVIKNALFTSFINKGVYCVSFLGILIVLPQTLNIWVGKNTSGVSLITWSGFLVGSLFWLFYGIIHKEKPIIFTNLAGILMNLSIIFGLILIK